MVGTYLAALGNVKPLMLRHDHSHRLVRGNSSEIIDVGGVLNGIAAAEYSFGTSGVFDFNGAKYNVSTGTCGSKFPNC